MRIRRSEFHRHLRLPKRLHLPLRISIMDADTVEALQPSILQFAKAQTAIYKHPDGDCEPIREDIANGEDAAK